VEIPQEDDAVIATKLDTLPLPDTVIRLGIRHLLNRRLDEIYAGNCEAQMARKMALIAELATAPIAAEPDAANIQHYELPTSFFSHVLGPAMKYSACLWEDGVKTLKEAEIAMLDMVAERAQLYDGAQILDLGCGWGSFTIYAAKRYPNARIVGVTNSRSQGQHILKRAERRGLNNVEILTGDINRLDISDCFDRIVSIEMFEHMRNYGQLSAKIAPLLVEDGRLFVHIFTHREHPYLFNVRDENDWIAKHFFTGGTMPSPDLLPYCFDDFRCEKQWQVNGCHHAKTAEAWLRNMGASACKLQPLMRQTYGRDADRWWLYWRVFFMSCAEFFGFNGGDEWPVTHYRFRKAEV
jgi:cyclopropane-fatty-acyl-phospholipid synthase